MNDKDILTIGKLTLGISFLLGNICLFGYIITRNEKFAAGGYLLLMIGSILNLLVAGCLLTYGLFHKSKLNICLKSVQIILINIPVAVLYAVIGISLL
jgi:hypothetical protein